MTISPTEKEIIKAAKCGDAASVERLLASEKKLVYAKDRMTPLAHTAVHNAKAVAGFLRTHGAIS